MAVAVNRLTVERQGEREKAAVAFYLFSPEERDGKTPRSSSPGQGGRGKEGKREPFFCPGSCQ